MKFIRSERSFVFIFFILVILAGSFLLYLPISWNGTEKLSYIDAFFTSTSAVCVTGLITVDTAQYSFFGKIVLLLLIQIGGLGVITFTTIYIVLPKSRISLQRTETIREFFINDVEYHPKRIIKQILFITFMIETIGAIILYFQFKISVPDEAILFSIFHSVSAFCNAGFSLFSANLEAFHGNGVVIYTISFLLIFGGIGFVVIRDVLKRITGKTKNFAYHSKIVLTTTAFLVIFGTILFFIFEYNKTMAGFSFFKKFANSFFQSVTPRTAGFNILRQNETNISSQILTLLLMFIGGSPGSTAGGIKTTTSLLLFLTIIKGLDSSGSMRLGHRKINYKNIFKALSFSIRAIAILFTSVCLCAFFEYSFGIKDSHHYVFAIIFECFSAFGTVGLSLGITPTLTIGGKLVIIMTMFAGRVGFMTLIMRFKEKHPTHIIDYPEEEVIVG